MSGGAKSPAGSPARTTARARIEKIIDHAADTRRLFLSLANGKRVRFVPGQFISITMPLGDETRSRPYTIASGPDESGPFEICFNRVPNGRGVGWLYDRKIGDEIEFVGPFGTFTMERAPEVEAGLIAEGTAIAPIRSMLKRALASSPPAKMHLIYAAADREHILYRSELEEFARTRPKFTMETVIAPPETVYERLHKIAETRWVKADANRTRQFYVCGVGKGVIRIRDLLRGSGYERRAVHYEQW